MDNNVQNIRSGRALAGFGKFFSGLGLVIAAIGAILGGAVPVIIVGVVLLILGGLMSSASGKKLQGAAQGGLAQAAMEQVLDTVLALCPAATFTLENQDCGPSLVWLREHGYGANT